MEDVKIIGGGHGDHVLVGMPGGVQDAAVEVERVHAYLVLFLLAANAHLFQQPNKIDIQVKTRKERLIIPLFHNQIRS